VRKKCYRKANYRCEICGGVGPNHPVECHEKWEYNDKTRIQKLTGLIALCPACHEVKHIGLASVNGRFYNAIEHLAKVNGCTWEDARTYAEEQMELWEGRNQFDWKLDTSYLDRYKREPEIAYKRTNVFERFRSK